MLRLHAVETVQTNLVASRGENAVRVMRAANGLKILSTVFTTASACTPRWATSHHLKLKPLSLKAKNTRAEK
jgi:biotin carboxylase